MRRRTLLGVLASARVPWAQRAAFPGELADTLREVAGVVLPAELGKPGLDRAAEDFARWVNGYREGAETDHGYGTTRIRFKGASPAPAYVKQLSALKGRVDADSIAAALKEAGVADLPRT